MESIWTKTVEIPRRNFLSGDRKADVAVIGGGLAGILTAYYLKEAGKNVIVLEADRIGSGQTGFTTAKITFQHGLIYDKLIRTMGKKAAGEYAAANQMAVEEYKRLIRSQRIDCHFEEKDAFLYSLFQTETLKKEVQAAKGVGLPAAFVTDTGLPFPVRGAVRFTGQAQFHPLEFLKEISAGLTVYERTRVLKTEGHKVVTPRGTVEAEWIVFACHYPFLNVPGFYFMRMYQERSYVLEVGPVSSLLGMYLSVDPDGYSLRSKGDHLLMGFGSHRTGKPRQGDPYEKMERAAKHFYPGSARLGSWSAQDCMTLDSVPYIGAFSASRPFWYVASGFGKWGMTSSMVSAKLISAQIMGQSLPYEKVFSPRRFTPRASAANFLSHGAESVKGLARGALPGVPRCPHLGCRLVWNKADKVWECPCHGSRFDRDGKISAGPAQENIPFIN